MPEKVGFVDETELGEGQPLGTERVGMEQALDGLRPVGLGEQCKARLHLRGGHCEAQTRPLLYGGDEWIGEVHKRAEGLPGGKAASGAHPDLGEAAGRGTGGSRRVEAAI